MDWSTDKLPASERFDHWREVVCQTFFRLTPERSKTDQPFRAAIRNQLLGPAALTHIVSTGQVVDRSETDIAHDPTTSVCLNIQISGRGRITQLGHSVVLGAGEACLVTTSEPFRLEFDQAFHQLAVHLPHGLIEPYLPRGELVARSLPTSPTSSLVLSYAKAGANLPATSAAADRLTRHLCEVIGLALVERYDQDHSLPQSSLRAAAIDEIRLSLTDPELSPTSVARRLASPLGDHVEQPSFDEGADEIADVADGQAHGSGGLATTIVNVRWSWIVDGR